MTNDQKPKMGDDAPGWKDVLVVFLIVALLILFSWIAWFKFGWFH